MKIERLVCFDIETTSFDYLEGHRIIEIGAVEILNDEITENSFHSFVNPEGKEIPDSSYQVHKISNKFLEDKPLFKDVAPNFLKFVGDSKIIAHNGKYFDFPFINHELKNVNLPIIEKEQQIDSLILAKEKLYETKYSLDALAKWFNISLESRSYAHGALIDSEILAKVFLELKKIKPLKTVDEYREEQHNALLNIPKGTYNFPERHFYASDEELEQHNTFMQKILNNH